MAEQPKPNPPTQEHPYPQAAVGYPPQPFSGAAYPPPGPGAYPPPFYYAPAPDGNHAENGQNGAPAAGGPYMMFPPPPPGMVYAYQPQGQAFPPPPTNQAPPALTRPKRKQVKMACTNCAAACKRCDENRPCERCVKYGVSETCVDGQRKERKKGIKRGPYRRKNKPGTEGAPYGGEWAPAAQSPPSTATTTAAIHAVAHQFAPPPTEGPYYPVYYPPGPFMPHPHEGQPGTEATGAPHANGQPPIMPYYIHPGSYPPYAHFPPPMYPQGTAPQVQQPQAQAQPHDQAQQQQQQQPQQQPQPQTMNPADVTKKPVENAHVSNINSAGGTDQGAGGNKKRPRASKNGEPKPKKVRGSARSGGKEKEDGVGGEQGQGGEGGIGPT